MTMASITREITYLADICGDVDDVVLYKNNLTVSAIGKDGSIYRFSVTKIEGDKENGN